MVYCCTPSGVVGGPCPNTVQSMAGRVGIPASSMWYKPTKVAMLFRWGSAVVPWWRVVCMCLMYRWPAYYPTERLAFVPPKVTRSNDVINNWRRLVYKMCTTGMAAIYIIGCTDLHSTQYSAVL